MDNVEILPSLLLANLQNKANDGHLKMEKSAAASNN